MFNNLLLQDIRLRQIVEVVETVVLEPEDIETSFIASHQLYIAEELKSFCSNALVTVFRVVAGDEIPQVLQLERAGFQGEMFVGAQIVEPDSLSVDLSVLGLSVKKHYVGLHALGLKDTGGKAQDGVHIAVFQ